ncbi:MAG TPA: 5-oxoprolinase subunit PxpB [Dokdonella sp.]
MTAAGGSIDFAIEPLGESVLLLRFGDTIDAALNARVLAAADTLRRVELPGLLDLVPAYATLALHYDTAFWVGRNGDTAWQHLAGALRAVFAGPLRADVGDTRQVEIPVCYGGEFGPDLADVAHRTGLDPDQVIARHAAADYHVAMLGFAPGFAYLLGLDGALEVPRRADPRTRVPRGSVAIGGLQTGIYPAELPGGWQLIGRTPLALFDAASESPCLLAPGDRVRLRVIDAGEFDALARIRSP